MFRNTYLMMVCIALTLVSLSGHHADAQQAAAPSMPGLNWPPRTPNGWLLQCKEDAIVDTYMCHIQRGSLYITMFRSRNGITLTNVSIVEGKQSHPDRLHALRVDSMPPHTNSREPSWNGPEAHRIVAELLQGHLVRTRYVTWPFADRLENEIPLAGFPVAWEELQQRFQ